MSANDGGAAFPSPRGTRVTGEVQFSEPGMSLRDYFAAHAPPAPDGWGSSYDFSEDRCADWAYTYADAMLAERAKG